MMFRFNLVSTIKGLIPKIFGKRPARVEILHNTPTHPTPNSFGETETCGVFAPGDFNILPTVNIAQFSPGTREVRLFTVRTVSEGICPSVPVFCHWSCLWSGGRGGGYYMIGVHLLPG